MTMTKPKITPRLFESTMADLEETWRKIQKEKGGKKK